MLKPIRAFGCSDQPNSRCNRCRRSDHGSTVLPKESAALAARLVNSGRRGVGSDGGVMVTGDVRVADVSVNEGTAASPFRVAGVTPRKRSNLQILARSGDSIFLFGFEGITPVPGESTPSLGVQEGRGLLKGHSWARPSYGGPSTLPARCFFC